MNNLFAYIDPGTTAFIWQIVAGVVVTLAAVITIWWTKVSTFFKALWVKMFGKNKNNIEDNYEQVQNIEDEEL